MVSCLIVTGDKPARDSIRVGFEQLQGFDIETADGKAYALGYGETPLPLTPGVTEILLNKL